MKKSFLSLLLAAVGASPLCALNDVLQISQPGVESYVQLTQIDSLWFSADGATLYLLAKDSTEAVCLSRTDISAMRYISSDDAPTQLEIAYSGSSVSIRNPYLLSGVSVSADGAYVTVNNTNITSEIVTSLSGSTSNGAYVYNGTYKTTLQLNGVEITSQRGAAIDIQCGKRIDLLLKKNTVSTLVDCADGEQKAALYCKGHLEIDKAGTLNVTGKTAHAISAKEYIKLKKSTGTINVLGAVKDGIHCQQYFMGNGYNVNISNVLDDGILVELDGEANDDEITDGSFILNAGTYNINIPATTSASKTTAWGPGGGGGWPGGGGEDSSTGAKAKGIKAEGPVVINDGTLIIQTNKSEAEGLESKTSVTINGGNHYLKCYDDCINSSGIITFAGGNTVCYGYKNDAVDSNYGKKGAITISGGSVFAYSTAGSPEEGLDCDNNSYIVITGGIAISAGGSQGGGGGGWGGSSSSSQSVGSSTQGYFLGSSPSSYGTSYYYTLCNTSGTAICTYKFEGSVSNSLSLLTASDLGKGSVTVKYGTSAPTASSAEVSNLSGTPVFWVAPTVTTTGTTATITAK